jgi:5-methylcytosine-specific restriction endonuclease McrA
LGGCLELPPHTLAFHDRTGRVPSAFSCGRQTGNMANQWLRLWHDMPTDPKWIVIAEKSGQPISLVLSVFIHILTNASQSPQRGTLHHWSDEDVAAALRTQQNAIELIRTHMNGKVLNGDLVLDWKRFRSPGVSNRPSSEVWRAIRDHIFKRDNYTCGYCGEYGKRLECDHKVPVSKGGSHDYANLITACFRCNRSKRDKLIAEWRPL